MIEECVALVHKPRPMFYRFEDRLYSEARLMLVRSVFPVIKTTPCGAWIDIYGQKKFVLLNARKRYACPSEAEALESYYARKERQVKILRFKLARAEAALALSREKESVYF